MKHMEKTLANIKLAYREIYPVMNNWETDINLYLEDTESFTNKSKTNNIYPVMNNWVIDSSFKYIKHNLRISKFFILG